jgi:hypothetical protein
MALEKQWSSWEVRSPVRIRKMVWWYCIRLCVLAWPLPIVARSYDPMFHRLGRIKGCLAVPFASKRRDLLADRDKGTPVR